MTPLGRGIISSGKLDAGGGGTFPVSMADMTAPTQWVSGTKSTALQNLNSDQTWSTRVKLDAIGSGGTGAIMTLNGGALSARASRISLSGGSIIGASFPTIGVVSGFTTVIGPTAATGTWYHLVLRLKFGTSDIDLFVNNTKYNNTLSSGSTDAGSSGYDINLGSWADASDIYNLDGLQGITRVWDRALSDAEVTEDYNGAADEYICYDNLSSGLLTGLLFDSDLGTYTGHGTALSESTGNSSLTNNGTIPFTGSGLTVDC